MGALVGGILSSLMGQQGNQSGTSNTNSTGSQSSSQQGQSTSTPNEDPIFTFFRQSILPAIAQQYSEAQKPVYGDAQTSQYTQQANDVYNKAMQGVNDSAARRGTLNSGSTDAAATSLAQGRAGNISNYFAQIPFLNQQAQWGKTQDLLGLATNFLGRSPLGQTTTSDQSGQSQFQQNQTGTSTSKSSSNPSLFGIPL